MRKGLHLIVLQRIFSFSLLVLCAYVCQGQDDSLATDVDSVVVDVTTGIKLPTPLSAVYRSSANKVDLSGINKQPFVSIQQMLKGNAAGVYIQEPSGEPGTEQNIFVNGLAYPLLNKRDLFEQQAVVYLNGIPLTRENPFAYEIQQYDFNRIGPATNLLSIFPVNNIRSIRVIKDPVELSALGPQASNGAIWVTTENADAGLREINVNTYFGIVPAARVTPVNAAFENEFRQPFYNKYATTNDRLNYPPFLRDSTSADYYGPSNWTDLYYKNTPVYSADLSLTGGSERANFRFFGNGVRDANSADNTSFSRYNGSFFINVAPIKWLMVSSMINYNRLSRTRNRNVRDRLAEQRYIPDLTNPLTPNKSLYGSYLSEFDKAIDNNVTNAVQGYLALSANFNNIFYNGRLGFDYNENIRDAFWPTTLLEGNNFVSGYFGYNQRIVLTNTLGYKFEVSDHQNLTLEGGQSYTGDTYRYDYAYAFNGPNDFIKINVVNGDPNAGDYLDPRGFRVNYFPAKQQMALASFWGNAAYTYNDFLKLSALVRRDGSSYMQPDNRWFTGYAGSLEWDLTKSLLQSDNIFNSLVFNLSWGRMGKLLSDDRFSGGPHYRVDMGWTGEPTIGSYAGITGLTRPYTSGWVGYNLPWSYSDKLSAGFRFNLYQNRLRFGVDLYNRDDKEMVLPVPVASEWGYTGAYEAGLEVNNKGVDVSINADIVLPRKERGFSWTLNTNLTYNKNEVKALPGGLNELVLGNYKLEVGKNVDAFWVYQNNGIYNSDSEVPQNTQTGQTLSLDGVTLRAGDPRWIDVNGDYIINTSDKVLAGNYMPKFTGGLGNSLSYAGFGLDFQFYFVGGRNVINQYASNRLNFINTESNNDINSVKEITYWEKKMDLTGYPMYNPWSPVIPYRQDQDLFLDNASFVKLRSLTLSYDLAQTNLGARHLRGFRQCMLYLTGTNLLTFTSFNGDDPELSDYNGVYSGYGLPMPRSVIVGVKLNF